MMPFRKFCYCRAMSIGTFIDKVYLELPEPDAWWDRDFNGKTPAAALKQDNVNLLFKMFATTVQELRASMEGSCSVCGEPGAEEIVDGHLLCPDCVGEMVEAGTRLDEMLEGAEENPLDVRLPSE